MPHKAPDPAAPSGLGALHQRRVRRLLLLCGGIVGIYSLFWGVYFASEGLWLTVALDGAALLLAGTGLHMVRQGRLRAATWLMCGLLYALLCLNAALIDVPTDVVPRSAHQFLLALGVATCLLLRDEPPWLRHGAPLLCLASYVFFASTHGDWVTPLALPLELRRSGVWVNQAVAMLVIYLVLHVIQNDVDERQGLEAELLDALVRGQMVLHYQPQVGPGGRLIGAEALVRWQHPRRGLLPPSEFVALAERCGLMRPLGNWVRQEACRQLADWAQRSETADLVLAVNVSADEFAQPDFVAQVQACVKSHGANPQRLKLELTESTLAHDLDDLIAKMSALKTLGIAFSLDDFGTGFSSLSYLRRLPLDQLKIDQSFIHNILSAPQDAAIAQAVLSLGRSLSLDVIAEGVETAEQQAALTQMGCEQFQGYLFGQPLAAAAFEGMALRSAR